MGEREKKRQAHMHITHKLIWDIWSLWRAWYTYTIAERMQLLSSLLSICISIVFIRFTTAQFADILTTHETREKSLERKRERERAQSNAKARRG